LSKDDLELVTSAILYLGLSIDQEKAWVESVERGHGAAILIAIVLHTPNISDLEIMNMWAFCGYPVSKSDFRPGVIASPQFANDFLTRVSAYPRLTSLTISGNDIDFYLRSGIFEIRTLRKVELWGPDEDENNKDSTTLSPRVGCSNIKEITFLHSDMHSRKKISMISMCESVDSFRCHGYDHRTVSSLVDFSGLDDALQASKHSLRTFTYSIDAEPHSSIPMSGFASFTMLEIIDVQAHLLFSRHGPYPDVLSSIIPASTKTFGLSGIWDTLMDHMLSANGLLSELCRDKTVLPALEWLALPAWRCDNSWKFLDPVIFYGLQDRNIRHNLYY
jgi:hypothetical protein